LIARAEEKPEAERLYLYVFKVNNTLWIMPLKAESTVGYWVFYQN